MRVLVGPLFGRYSVKLFHESGTAVAKSSYWMRQSSFLRVDNDVRNS